MTDPNSTVLGARVDRRALLRNSLLAVGAGVVLAACGDRSGNTDPGRVGVAAPLPTLPETGEVTDAIWLRTLQSLEHSMLAVYAGIAQHGGLPGKAAGLAEPFTAAHRAAAEQLAELVTAAGGESFACPNPFFTERYVEPVLAALPTTDDVARDARQIAYWFEEWTARSYQAVAARSWDDPSVRVPLINLAAEASRRAAGLALAYDPANLLSPALFGETVSEDAEGFAMMYAIASQFGQVGAIELRYGQANADGARATVSLQTPADNSLVYASLSC